MTCTGNFQTLLLLSSPLLWTLYVQSGGTMRVVNLETCRDLLRVWAEVRNQLMSGADGFVVSVKKHGVESVFSAGTLENDTEEASRAAMRASWELAKHHHRRRKKV